jgi:hypothetical protein
MRQVTSIGACSSTSDAVVVPLCVCLVIVSVRQATSLGACSSTSDAVVVSLCLFGDCFFKSRGCFRGERLRQVVGGRCFLLTK